MNIDPTDPRPAYQQIASHLREAIRRGEYPAGKFLPSSRNLAQTYEVTQVTARHALAVLVAEGLVDVRPSGGHFVRATRALVHTSTVFITESDDRPVQTWGSALAQEGRRGSQRILMVGRVIAPIEVAERLRLEPDGAQVVVRRRVMLVEETPYQLADSYYPAEIAAGTPLEQPARLPGGTVAALKALGLEPVRHIEELTVRMPTPEERKALEMSPGVPVQRLIRTTYVAGDRPVEVMDALMAGDRHSLVYELPARRNG